jgi:hypothetical protein
MSLVNIDIKDNTQTKKPIVFGSAVDLAHAFNKEWAINNLKLLSKTDKTLQFIYYEVVNKNADRNFFEKYIFKKKIKKSRTILNLYIRELRVLINEVEALIGFNAYLREGKKSKIKNKKVFDDHITERREIAIMLLGLLTLLGVDQVKELDFDNERKIMKEIQLNSEKTLGYFLSTYSFFSVFDF